MKVESIINSAIDTVINEEGSSIKEKVSEVGQKIKDKIRDWNDQRFVDKIREMPDKDEQIAKGGSKIAKLLLKAHEPELAAGVGARTLRAHISNTAEEGKEKVTSVAKKAVEAVKENPGASVAIAAALAAGVGALALRKRLKKAEINNS